MKRRTGIAAAILGSLIVVPLVSCGRASPVRTVALHMSGYAFNDSNPTLTFRTGERVRFLVTNDETTMIRHNLRIAGLGVPCDYELGPGETRIVEVTMPSNPGVFTYDCCTHRGMAGKLVVARR